MTVIDTQPPAPSSLPNRRSLASFFIARPVFAIVLAIGTCLAGAVGIYSLPISQYPEIAPTTISIRASYSGASAGSRRELGDHRYRIRDDRLQRPAVLESSSATGSASVTLTFGNTIDADIAQVQVQNKLGAGGEPSTRRGPAGGLTVNRSGSSILMIGNIISEDGRYTSEQLPDIMSTTVEPVIGAGRRCRWHLLIRFGLCHAHLARSAVAGAIQADPERCDGPPSSNRTSRSRSAPLAPRPMWKGNNCAHDHGANPIADRRGIRKHHPGRRQ